jgi:hypothetical protein
MRSTCGVYTTAERATIARPVLDACVDDVEVEGEYVLEDVLAHGCLKGEKICVSVLLNSQEKKSPAWGRRLVTGWWVRREGRDSAVSLCRELLLLL